jgi:hypothetical protein
MRRDRRAEKAEEQTNRIELGKHAAQKFQSRIRPGKQILLESQKIFDSLLDRETV